MSFFGIIVLVLLVILVLGLFKASPQLGYAPGGIVTILLIVLLILVLSGRI